MRILPAFLLALLLLTDVHGAASTCEFPLGPGILANSDPFFAGMPLATDLASQPTAVLENTGFTVGYSDEYKNPLWVCYRLFSPCDCAPRSRESIGFRNDLRTHTSVTDDFHRDITQMDRGHLAPNSAIARCYGTQAQDETFLLTNISPQNMHLNEGIWEELEALVLDCADAFGEVWVITGPIFDTENIQLLNTSEEEVMEPAVPTSFYKIVIRKDSSLLGMDTLAFIFPNENPQYPSLEDYLESIEEIQSQTGLDFLWQMDDGIEQTLEATMAPCLWDTSQVTADSTIACGSTVVINEFEANPTDSDIGREWVELYNTGSVDIPVGGWILQTVSGATASFPLPVGATIPANGFYVFEVSSRRFTNGYEVIELRNTEGQVIDSTPASGLSDNLNNSSTWSRIQDGGILWHLSDATKGSSNE